METQLRGIKWMLLASFTLSVISIIMNKAELTINLVQSYFLMCITITVITAGLMLLKKESFYTHFITSYTIRALSTASSMMLWFYVLKLLPVNELTAISYMTPLLNVMAGVVIFKEYITMKRVMAVLIGFIGVLIIIRPVFSGEVYSYSMAILTVIIWVLGDVLIKAQTHQDTTLMQIFYVYLTISLLLLPIVIFQWQIPTVKDMVYCLLVGLLQFINFYAVFKAYKYSALSIVVPFDFSRMLFTLSITYIIFGERISITAFVGALLIMIATVYLTKNLKRIYL
ncbi:EamA-like transporter family protein [Rickettsiales bacterium Ac37b]|nr:EamA-like transporter family protein [Rickettsiales bacterium Ac37b]